MRDPFGKDQELIEESAVPKQRIKDPENSGANIPGEGKPTPQTEAMEASMDGMAILNEDQEYVYANKAHARIYGYDTAKELLGQSWRILYDEDELKRFDHTIMPEFSRKGEWRGEARGKKKDGSTFSQDVSLTALGNGGLICVVRDVTERKQAEEALKESEALQRTLLANLPAGVIIIDPVTRMIESVNNAAAAMFGVEGEQIVGHRCHTYLCPASEDACPVLDLGQNVDNSEREMICVDGSRRPVLKSVKRIQIRGQEKLLECFIDITDRKRAEEEKRNLESQLLQAQKMEAIGTLAGGIAHDFNNLLMGIQGYASLMILGLDIHHPHYERLKRIEEQVQSAADLTKQLLGFARGGKYETRPVNINEIIEKTSSTFGRTKKELTIHGKYERDLWAVEADQSQIEQVLLNLYVNAWHAMQSGGELYLETRNVTLNESLTNPYAIPSGNYVKISVADTGMGMDEETRKRIFDPFFTTKEMGRGTGLGLAMVYGIMKGHNGFVDVVSEPGKGTTFTLYLPASGKEVLEEKPTVPEMIKGSETILFVDDEPCVLEVGKDILESLGYTVHEVSSGQEAVAFYKEMKDTISLIIIDMVMPGLSGSETFDRIRELNPSAKILLSSGYSLEGKAQQIMDKGCQGFIQKPFNITHISQKIREVLETGGRSERKT